MSASAGKPAVLIASGPWPAEPWADTIRNREPDRQVTCWPDLSAPDKVAYLLAWRPPAEALRGLANLKLIFSLGAGVDGLIAQADLPDVPIVRIISDDLAQRMTEWVTLQVLIHHRQQRAYDRAQDARIWQERRQPAASEVRVGIMGMGVLGRHAAHVLVQLGFNVGGWSRSARPLDGVEMFGGESGLDPFLARTDILVCLLPLTSATRRVLARPLLEKLARDGALGGPVLINAGRGGLQVEADIDRCLADGTLIGASLDVFETEPLDRASPLWRHANLVITPHCSAPSSPVTLAAYIHRQIMAYEAGRPLDGVVDRAAGY